MVPLYPQRGAFAPVFDSYPRSGQNLSVGTNGGTFVFGNTGFDDFGGRPPVENTLVVWNTNTPPPTMPLAETTPYRQGEFGPIVHQGWYRRVDISAGTVAYENCCTPEHEVRILEGGAPYSLVYDPPGGWTVGLVVGAATRRPARGQEPTRVAHLRAC